MDQLKTQITQRISIHAPVKGATAVYRRHSQRGFYFNPRTREGCDHYMAFTQYIKDTISIHAPVKGATDDDAHQA